MADRAALLSQALENLTVQKLTERVTTIGQWQPGHFAKITLASCYIPHRLNKAIVE
jgi:hypothetical protein